MMNRMTVLSVIPKTEERFKARARQRRSNLLHIKSGDILAINANTPELLRKRLLRLRADPEEVLALTREGQRFEPLGPGQSSRVFPRGFERILASNDLLGLRFLEQGLRVSQAVGRIHICGEQGKNLGYGTGFMVSPRLLLTNHHVLSSAVQAQHCVVEFNYQESESGELKATEIVRLQPEAFFLSDDELDYSLVAVAADADLSGYGWLPLIEDTGKLLVGESVNIIQHPNGEPKQLAVRHNQVVDELELFLHYQTDTDPGSSGSPVFNDQWEVVALHHSGVPKRNEAGEVITSDGRVWQEWMGEQRIAWQANEGVRVSRLVRHVREQKLPAEAEALRQELLEAVPPPSRANSGQQEGEVWLDEEEPAVVGPPLLPTEAVQQGGPGALTWTIPLQVSVTLGTPVLGSATPAMTLGASPAGSPPQASSSIPGVEESSETRGLWSLLGRRPPQPPAPPPPPPVSAADFRLGSLASVGFHWPAALSLCLASELAYRDPSEVKAQASAWGLRDSVFVQQQAAQGFLAWTPELVLVSFRGTESTADWLSNLNVTTRTIRGIGPVHAGFLGQFQALQPEMERLLGARPELPLLITGHSLGGAIAVVAAATWASRRAIQGLYTYGQPAVGQGKAAASIGSALSGRYHRLVNHNDIVPRVPPGFQHAGHLLRFDGQGRVTEQETTPRPAPAGARGSAFEATTAVDDTMLSAEDFETLQQQLRATTAPPGARGQERMLGLISDHMLPDYLGKIRQQLG
jgi:V8-like Glu-specific endopeptidase